MRDFSSAHYLGLDHKLGSLPPQLRLTTGKPAALSRSTLERDVRKSLQGLLRAKHADVRRSSLHAFVDIYSQLRADHHVVLLDAAAYPVQKWAIDMARGRGVAVRKFGHHDTNALVRALADFTRHRLRPVVATDGYCTSCGRLAPIAEYLDAIQHFGGHLLVDDTQCTGILGANPGSRSPWGNGGGGSHLHAGAGHHPAITIVTSFAKGLAAPVAAVASESSRLLPVGSGSETHSSPATNADLAALRHALAINALFGDRLRRRLLSNIHVFRRELKTTGMNATGGIFPVQCLNVAERYAPAIERELRNAGIRVVMAETCARDKVSLYLIITARHRPKDIVIAVGALQRALSQTSGNDLVGNGYSLRRTY